MPKQSHPAQRARFAVGLAGATGFVAMVPNIAEGSKQISSIDLPTVVSDARSFSPPQLDLDGTALAGAAARTAGGPAVPNTIATPASSDEVTATQPTETTVNQPSETATDAAPASTQALATTEAPVTAAPPATTNTTAAAPTTDTTSSAS